ncbi:MAG: hypothetical protein IK129_06395 [Deltaproteobacteria bacterium]|nr:hypothetical protein [Deltaproteobacteria bacterium]
MGLEKLEEIRREKCRQYCQEHEREILQELRARERERHYWKNFHLAWFRAAGLDLSLDKSGQVVWAVRPGFEKLWAFSPGQLPRAVSGALVDIEWRCWRHGCRYRREILAALQPCKSWKSPQPSGGCLTLEEFLDELEKKRRRGLVAFCPFLDMWICGKDCPKWCGRWNERLTEGEGRIPV